MEHPYTWYNALPESLQHMFGDHTFFALVAALLLILFAIKARGALAKASDPVVPAAELGSRNIAELIVQLIVSQSDAIIGKAGRKYVPFFGTFFFFILVSNLMGLAPGFAPPTGNLNTTFGLAIVSFIAYNVIGVREMGMAYFKHFVGPMTSLPGSGFLSKLAFIPLLLLSVTFFFVLELISHSFRPRWRRGWRSACALSPPREPGAPRCARRDSASIHGSASIPGWSRPGDHRPD